MADGRFVSDFGPIQSGGAVILIEKTATESVLAFQVASQTGILTSLLSQHQQHQSLPPAGRDAQSGDLVILIEQNATESLLTFQAASQTVRLVDGIVAVTAKPSGGVTPPVVETTAVRAQKASVLSG